jgi:thiosulfate/3-mercaptopyruvate sulfurtransferase
VIFATDLDVLVDPAWVAEHVDDPAVRFVEVDVSPAKYNEGHVRGAVLWNAYGDLRDADYRPVSRAHFQRILERSGIGRDTTVVLYGYGSLLGFWLMKAHGHPDARMVNADREELAGDEHVWSSGDQVVQPTSYPLPDADRKMLASLDDAEAATRSGDALLLDVRSPAEFQGERFWPSGATENTGRAGHMPGAVHVPIDLVRDERGVVKDTDELRQLYADAGVSPDARVITYCTIGNRASLAWFILTYILGYPNVAVYQGSWVEWGKLPDTPVET